MGTWEKNQISEEIILIIRYERYDNTRMDYSILYEKIGYYNMIDILEEINIIKLR